MGQAHDPPTGAGAPYPAPRPAVSPSTWAALDADYRDDRPPPPDRSTQLPTVGFSGRFWHVDPEVPADVRLRLEGPVLLAWLLISCFWQGFIPWTVMGLVLIAAAIAARPAFRPQGLGARPWVYGAIGLGQIMLACSYITNLGPFWPFVGLYWLGLILTWVLVELRRLLGKGGGRSVF